MSVARTVATIVSGGKHTLCISTENTVFSFGFYNESFGDTKVDTALHMDFKTPKMIPTLKHIKSITAVEQHSVCLDNDGNVFTFGSNDHGQLGIIPNDNLDSTFIPQKVNLPPCKEVSCGNGFTICLSNDGFAYSFGYNQYGQLGLGNKNNYNSPQLISSLKDVEFVECGGYHVFCKTLNNEKYCWGNN